MKNMLGIAIAIYSLSVASQSLADDTISVETARQEVCLKFRVEARESLSSIEIGDLMQESISDKMSAEFDKPGSPSQTKLNELNGQMNYYVAEEHAIYQALAAQVSVYSTLGCPLDDLVESLYCFSNLNLRSQCIRAGILRMRGSRPE